MIRARDAVETARGLIGTPYAKMDCMALIVQVIRRSPGGVKSYRCQGTNWLWDSVKESGRYRHLLDRREGIGGAQAGMLAFKRYAKDDEGHVGLVSGEGTVIHASSEHGRVVETPLTSGQGWDLLGIHRHIRTGEEKTEVKTEMNPLYRAEVVTREQALNLRSAPENGRVIAKMPKGTIVDVMSEGEWACVAYDGMQGYASGEYLQRIEEGEMRMVFTDEAGNTWIPEGGFRAQMRMTNRHAVGGIAGKSS